MVLLHFFVVFGKRLPLLLFFFQTHPIFRFRFEFV
jgi:hypothetical protein